MPRQSKSKKVATGKALETRTARRCDNRNVMAQAQEFMCKRGQQGDDDAYAAPERNDPQSDSRYADLDYM